MNKKFTIGIAALVLAVFAFMPVLGISAKAESNKAAFAQTARAAMLIDADTGSVIFEKNVTEHYPIASMVKIMTLGVVLDEIEKREIPLNTCITASQNAASMGGSQAFLDANAQYRLDELIKSIVVASANDSCVAVAEYLFGSVDAFVTAMNEKASALGLTNTKFANCTGLPGGEQYSCASDVAVMFGELVKHNEFFDYAKVWMYDFEHPGGRVTQLTNTNKLIRFYNGCDGGKTGYTNEARSCLAATAKRGDTRLVCVVIGAENSKTRNKEVSELFDYGLANYKTVYAIRSGENMGEFSVANGVVNSVQIQAANNLTVFVKSGDECNIEIVPEIGELKAPIACGDKLGKIKIKVNGSDYGEVDAVAATACSKKGYRDIINEFIKSW